jgi:hypothetical protein
MRFSWQVPNALSAILGLVCLAGLSSADTLTLTNGRAVQGSYLGGDARSIRMAVGDRVETYAITDVASITFNGAVASTPPPAAARRAETAAPLSPPRAAEASPTTRYEIPSGTVLTVRMVDSVDSERDSVGQTYRASLDEPVMDSRGDTLVPRGADVVVKLVDDKESGKLTGTTELTLDLVSLRINGRDVEIDTVAITQESGSRTARSAKVVGGTAALGAIIGAIAGGGKGAAIGAASGAGAGTAVQVMTKGQRVRIPSETRLTFTLQQPVRW